MLVTSVPANTLAYPTTYNYKTVRNHLRRGATIEIVYSPLSLEPAFHLCLCLNLPQLPSRIHNLLQNLHTTAATNTYTQKSCKSVVTETLNFNIPDEPIPTAVLAGCEISRIYLRNASPTHQ